MSIGTNLRTATNTADNTKIRYNIGIKINTIGSIYINAYSKNTTKVTISMDTHTNIDTHIGDNIEHFYSTIISIDISLITIINDTSKDSGTNITFDTDISTNTNIASDIDISTNIATSTNTNNRRNIRANINLSIDIRT